jgi:hypothetical protein
VTAVGGRCPSPNGDDFVWLGWPFEQTEQRRDRPCVEGVTATRPPSGVHIEDAVASAATLGAWSASEEVVELLAIPQEHQKDVAQPSVNIGVAPEDGEEESRLLLRFAAPRDPVMVADWVSFNVIDTERQDWARAWAKLKTYVERPWTRTGTRPGRRTGSGTTPRCASWWPTKRARRTSFQSRSRQPPRQHAVPAVSRPRGSGSGSARSCRSIPPHERMPWRCRCGPVPTRCDRRQ